MASRPLLAHAGPVLFATAFYALAWSGLAGWLSAALSAPAVATGLWWMLRRGETATCLETDCLAAYPPVDDHER